MQLREPAGARDAATTQQVIHEAIGTNRDVARVTWMALSGDVDAMLTMRDAARRDLLAQVFGIDRYGESEPAPKLFEFFGFTPENVADTVRKVLRG